MEPPELIPGVKRLTFKQIRGSGYWYPRAIKRCRQCGTTYAPYAALWSDDEPDTCAICAAPLPKPKPLTDGGSHD